jgi:protein TonB
MQKRLGTIVLTGAAIFSLSAASQAQTNLAAKSKAFQPPTASAPIESDRVKDGLVGPVRRVRTEIVKLAIDGGKFVESKRTLLEVVAYDIRGNKVENQYFPVTGSTLTGKEVYKYDDKGNISEMTLLNEDGSLVGKEAYKYEFDFAGNWNKMTTTVAVVEGGKLSFEPTEVTYRSIMYYLDPNLLKKAQPAEAGSAAASSNGTTADLTKNNVEVKAPAAENTTPRVSPAKNDNSAPAVPLPSNEANLNVMSSTDLEDVSPNLTADASLVHLDSEPPSASPKPLLKPISGGVLNGTAIQLPSPGYPDAAKRMRTSGVVTVEVVIDEYGKVVSAKASGGPSTLRDAAVQAALRARFSPTTLSGQPVKVSGVIHYKFSLQ